MEKPEINAELFDELFTTIGVEAAIIMLDCMKDYLVPDSPPTRASTEEIRKFMHPLIAGLVAKERSRIRELRTGQVEQ